MGSGVFACVCVRERSAGGFVKGCAGVQDAHPKETNVSGFCIWWSSVFQYPACSQQFQEKSNSWPPATSGETEGPEILGNTCVPTTAKASMLNFRVTLWVTKYCLQKSAGNVCFISDTH